MGDQEAVLISSDDDCEIIACKQSNSVIIISDSDEGESQGKNGGSSSLTSDSTTSRNLRSRKRKHEKDGEGPRSAKIAKKCNSFYEENARNKSTSINESNISSRTRSHITINDNDDASTSSNTSLFRCPFCPHIVPFDTETSGEQFKEHFMEVHLKKYYKCRECNIGFKNIFKAENHYSFCGDSQHLFKCPFCQRSETQITVADTLGHLVATHVKSSTSQPEFLVCPAGGCQRTFKTLLNNINHFLITHEQKKTITWLFSCVMCEKGNLAFVPGLVHYVEDHQQLPTGNAWDVIKQFCGKDWPVIYPTRGPSTRSYCSQNKKCIAPTNVHHLQNKTSNTQATSSHTISQNRSARTSSNHNLRPTRSQTSNSSSPENQPQFVAHLSNFKHIIFIDFDNWARLFERPTLVPNNVFVWMFCGGNFRGKRYANSPTYKKLLQENRLFVHPRCGVTKNAADFALCVQVARLDLRLPEHINFTVLSGDNGFGELQNQLVSSKREIHLINPHYKSLDFLSFLLNNMDD